MAKGLRVYSGPLGSLLTIGALAFIFTYFVSPLTAVGPESVVVVFGWGACFGLRALLRSDIPVDCAINIGQAQKVKVLQKLIDKTKKTGRHVVILARHATPNFVQSISAAFPDATVESRRPELGDWSWINIPAAL